MKTLSISNYAGFFVLLLLLAGCEWFGEKKEKIKISGKFQDTEGKLIETGSLEIYAFQDQEKEPKLYKFKIKEGNLKDEIPKANKYVVNVKVKGYGLLSKVFYNAIPDRVYQLKQATVTQFNPSIGGLVRDSKNNCVGSLSAQANWAADPWKELPIRINSSGQISGFGMSPELQAAYDYHARSKPCNNGITVNILPNSLTTTSTVNVSMSAIDLFSIDGMPGDYSIAVDQNRVGFMESYGAFSLEIYDGEKNFNLNKDQKKSAHVTFPVVGSAKGKDIPETIPVVYYDEVHGVWKKETEARLNRELHVYEAEVFHFSAINLDLEKTSTSCLAFLDPSEGASDAFVAPYRVEVTAPPTMVGGMPRVSSRTVNVSDFCTSPANQFALTRLPADTEVSIVYFDNTTTQPKGVYVFKTGAANTTLQDPAHPDCTELGLCGTVKPIQTNDFVQPSPEIYIAACKNTVSGNLIVSIATAPSVGTLVLTNYKLKVSRAGLGTPADCNWISNTLNTLTLVSDNSSNVPAPNVKIVQFSIPLSTALCTPASNYPEEKIELVDATTPTSVVSNSFFFFSCN